MRQVTWILLMLASTALATAGPKDFDIQLNIEVPDEASLLRLKLPEDVYRVARRADLGDVRIFNAAGEAVPMARLPRGTEVLEQRVELPLVTLPKVAIPMGGKTVVTQGMSGSSLRVEIDTHQGEPTAVPDYLIEVKGFDAPIDELILSWPESISFEAAVKILASDDLSGWRSVVRRAPLLAIGQGESRIMHNSVKLPAVKARYLRVSWVGTVPAVSLKHATLVHSKTSQASEYQWLTLDGTIKKNAIEYVSPGLFPVDKIRLVPVDDADVLSARIYSRKAVSARWRWLTRTLGYRLRHNGEIYEGSPDPVSMTHDPLWRVVLEKGARSSLPPRLQLGWVPNEIVFVARGDGPFTLAAGSASALPVWLAPEQVVPGFGTDASKSTEPAYITAGQFQVRPVTRNAVPWQIGSNWILWAVLVIGVGVLGVMARGLWSDMRSDATDDSIEKR